MTQNFVTTNYNCQLNFAFKIFDIIMSFFFCKKSNLCYWGQYQSASHFTDEQCASLGWPLQVMQCMQQQLFLFLHFVFSHSMKLVFAATTHSVSSTEHLRQFVVYQTKESSRIISRHHEMVMDPYQLHDLGSKNCLLLNVCEI